MALVSSLKSAPSPLMSKSERRMHHLRELMVQKVTRLYKSKTGKKITPSKLDTINNELDALLAHHNPSDNDLNKIVQLLMRNSKDSGSASHISQAPASSVGMMRDDAPSVIGSAVAVNKQAATPPQGGQRAQIPRRPMLPASGAAAFNQRAKQIQDDMWAKLSKKDVSEFERDETRRKMVRRDRMMEQRRALDEQVQYNVSRKRQEEEEEQRNVQIEAKKVEEWKQEMAVEDKKRKEAYETEKMERDAQLQDLDRRRAAEEEHKRMEEERIASVIRTELEAEQQQAVEKKMKAKESVAKFMQYNAEQRALKDHQKEKENELDRDLHKMYIDRLEKQEKEREDALRKLYDRQTFRAMQGSKLAAGWSEKAAEDERRAAREQELLLQKVQNEEKARVQAITSEKEKIKKCLAQQIADKERRRMEEKHEWMSLREHIANDVKKAEVQEKDRLCAKRRREVENKKAIQEQIRAKAQQPNSAMSREEMRINKELLRRLSDWEAK
eukprot:TRINITY_DN3163_c3_g1_i1.p1 TRINITY_DN3163_c3_g1~~TRINITY_DN3163_c3_g1_i1.p1  ORF type:complete len:499 (+),score=228.67 TRINITY_DN3163_c3_g1_i1:53-1549(+)